VKTALVITIGGTADPILRAVEEAQKEGGAVTVFLLYGRPFPGQRPSPFDVANEAKQKGAAIEVAVRLLEAANPEDINDSLKVLRGVFREAAEAERVIVNFTGGTKVLSAAAVHAALTEPLGGELILDYTGGPLRDEQGRVLREAMRVVRSERTATDEILQQVLERLRGANYREARLLTGRLPERGRAGFVKRATEALYLWDEFDYEASVQILRRLHDPAKALSDDKALSGLTELVSRLLEPGHRLCSLIPGLRQAQQGEASVGSQAQHFQLLVADALENALRRSQEGRATDSVLRSYRAVEVAVQARLLQNGVNPWRPNWERIEGETLKCYLDLMNASRPPESLALSAGLMLLQAMGQKLTDEGRKRLTDIQQLRNYSYLEHGYQRLKVDDAQRLNEYAGTLCEQLLGISLAPIRASVSHTW
jgi:CRISPR-associated protein (TIGR02710 family)